MMAAIRITSGPNKAWRAFDARTPVAVPSGSASEFGRRPARLALNPTSRHPFAEPGIAADLDRRETEIETGFACLDEVLRDLAPRQFEEGFGARAVAALQAIGIETAVSWFAAHWTQPLDLGAVRARCACRLFARLVETGSERNRHLVDDGEPVADLVRRWGFHAIDITPCSDGRLAGLLGAVLRVPQAIVTARKSFAGAMFPVAEALRDWERVELGRWRSGRPNPVDADSRYLKVGVYHFSSHAPQHEGCAAHGSDDAAAVAALHQRLLQFRAAVEARHGAGEQVALLMIGVDTDTDAIRVHVPDRTGAMQAGRYVDAASLHAPTADLDRDAAKLAVRVAVAACAGVETDDAATEGMRWFCGYLLKNNLAQVDAVLQKHAGPYPVAGHAEKLIVIGDPVDDVQLRNLAFQAQMGSVEEGGGDLAVGIHILGKTSPHGVPVLILRDYDPSIPGDREAAEESAVRMRDAVGRRPTAVPLTVEAALRSAAGGRIEFVTRAGRVSASSCEGTRQ